MGVTTAGIYLAKDKKPKIVFRRETRPQTYINRSSTHATSSRFHVKWNLDNEKQLMNEKKQMHHVTEYNVSTHITNFFARFRE
jgi:hypothetical protein